MQLRHALFLVTLGSALALRDPLPEVVSQLDDAAVQHRGHDDDDQNYCERWDWRKYALKLIKEIPVAGLFDDLKGNTKFEASGLTEHRGKYIMVYDSLHTIGVIDERLRFRDPENALLGQEGEESQYEAITVRTRTDTLLAVREQSLEGDGFAQVVELRLGASSTSVVKSCKFDYELPGDNKGFEGAAYYDAGDKGELLLGLCEGNFCEGNDERGQESGNGRVVVGRLDEDGDDCVWKTQKVINVPSMADFTDYSDIAFASNMSRVAITSQEDSAVWVGTFDWEELEFVGDGVVLNFPRGEHCDPLYCNVEGIEWIDEHRVMVVTDRAKKTQPWQCSAKDQSVQVFALPLNKHLQVEEDDEL